MEDILLVKKAIKGDREAFEDLINMYFDRLYKEAYLRCKHEEDAKEIVQETIYKAYRNIKSLKEPKYFKTWLSKILINVSNDYMRKNGMIELEHDENDYVKKVHNDDQVEIKIDLYNAIDELEDKYKDVIIFRYIEDLKIEDISKILEHPVNTIKTHIRKAIKDMKNLLKEDYIND
ncbi:sigma-70 family RNA polymerase sigma factor [Terrisporobacter mayombei]|uniref:RNA polymerase sigma factor SigV n=1 Tax=Terrisporobacter mayombei TaxID=1541 RepID=A0ABY9PVX1_9FIRM|nr:sigma-70 family RNA polymerase sigma factor [Terrisporobacter mayombei]MCC3869932.1 sigma-70 family RNA polymerase sigma factor [Terrisporobacter mayombei]WMT79822.1 RNA polymerase sigma factor SigV [Terrisporobacter mayombei]